MSGLITHAQSVSVSSDSSSTLKGSIQEAGSSEINISEPLPAGTANVEYDLAFAGNSLQSVVLLSNQNLTVLVNSTSSPALTINLVANCPYVWSKSAGYFANPFAGVTVTKFFLSCTPAATLRGKVLTA